MPYNRHYFDYIKSFIDATTKQDKLDQATRFEELKDALIICYAVDMGVHVPLECSKLMLYFQFDVKFTFKRCEYFGFTFIF